MTTFWKLALAAFILLHEDKPLTSKEEETRRIENDELIAKGQAYLNYTGGIYGVLAFPLGMTCLDMSHPRVYALMALVLLVCAWGAGLSPHKEAWTSITQRKLRGAVARGSIWAILAAGFGTLYLSFIFLGLLDKCGFTKVFLNVLPG